jgi:hypothetical protein
MARGSKPGERRGGRQRGTPNKKTVLRDAAISAAAADPNLSPLDFLLGLMRDANVPADLRVKMAQAAAPFLHSKPRDGHPDKPASGKDGALPADVNGKGESNTASPKAETTTKANGGPEGANADLLPLDFLLGLMRDPATPPHLRIKGAYIAAPFVHPKRGGHRASARKGVFENDPYGFVIDRALASTLRDLWLKLHSEDLGTYGSDRRIAAENLTRARILELGKPLECPDGYGPPEVVKDRFRVRELSWTRERGTKLTKEENAEEAQLVSRIIAYEKTPQAIARARTRQRIGELTKYGGPELTVVEQSELESLQALDPNVDVINMRTLRPEIALSIQKNLDAMMRARDAWRATAKR